MHGGNSDIKILPNDNTLQCILNVVGTKLKVSFDLPNSLLGGGGGGALEYKTGGEVPMTDFLPRSVLEGV